MARSRNIKPGFFKNELLSECSPLARILFTGLWCEADREGRLEDRPKRLKVAILPYDDCSIDDLIMELVQRGFVLRYEAGGTRYLQILNFLKHQQPHHKEAASQIPAPKQGASHAQDKHEPSMTQERVKQSASCPTDSLLSDSLNLIPDSKVARASPDAPTTPVWDAYATTYRERYGEPPVRNAKVNAQLKQLIGRIGAAEAPLVAQFYVAHPSAFYIQRGHSIACLLADAEKLRTEWATNRPVTGNQARQRERTADNPFARMVGQQEALGHAK